MHNFQLSNISRIVQLDSLSNRGLTKMAKKATVKRGRKPGQKVGPYKMNMSEMSAKIKNLEARLAKVEKVVG